MTREALKYNMETSYLLPQGNGTLKLMIDHSEENEKGHIEQYGIELSCGDIILQAKRMTTNRQIAEDWLTLLGEQQISPNQFYAVIEDLLP